MIYLSTFFLALFITITLIPPLRKLSVRLQMVDFPAARKVHVRPIPRCGGIAMALGAVLPVIFWAPHDDFLAAYLAGVGIIVLLGLIDDYSGLGYKSKFIGQIAAALILILYGGVRITKLGTLLPEEYVLGEMFSVCLTLVAVVGVTNAINLADGLDGLAGGISLLVFCCMGYLAYLEQDIGIVVISVALSGAIFGFLRFNTHPAWLFMGDAGSLLLGFSAAALSLALTQTGNTAISPLLPLLILGFPILDTITVMTERVSQGRSPFSPDKNHFHHRLMRLGLYHSESVFVMYVIQTLLVISAFLLRFHSEWTLLLSYILFSGFVVAAFRVADRTQWQFKRYDLIDRIVKGRLRAWKERGYFIRLCFKTSVIGIPLLLLFDGFTVKDVPVYLSIGASVLAAVLLCIMLLKKDWTRGALALALYAFIPFVIFLSETDRPVWLSDTIALIHNLVYLCLAILVILTRKLTRRQQGFRTTPMDFLVIVLALIVPITLGENVNLENLGTISAKIIMLFFSYEVLIGELRGDLTWLGGATLAALGVAAMRGLSV